MQKIVVQLKPILSDISGLNNYNQINKYKKGKGVNKTISHHFWKFILFFKIGLLGFLFGNTKFLQIHNSFILLRNPEFSNRYRTTT